MRGRAPGPGLVCPPSRTLSARWPGRSQRSTGRFRLGIRRGHHDHRDRGRHGPSLRLADPGHGPAVRNNRPGRHHDSRPARARNCDCRHRPTAAVAVQRLSESLNSTVSASRFQRHFGAGDSESASDGKSAPTSRLSCRHGVRMALDLSIVRRAIAIRIESLLGVDFDADMTIGEKVEWMDDCVELFANLA